MQLEKLKINEFTELLKLLEMSSKLNIIPYTWIIDPKTNESKCYVLMMQEITGFIRPFRSQTNIFQLHERESKSSEESSSDHSIGNCIAKTIRDNTFGLINIKEHRFNSTMNVFLYSDIDFEGETMIVKEKIPIVTVRLRIGSIERLNRLIGDYVQKIKTKLTTEPSSPGLSTNLIYMSSSELYYLSRGTTYSYICDDDSECEFEVSKGMFFDENIVDLYTPNRAEGEISLSEIPMLNANSPFQSITFSKISLDFGETIFDVMSNEEENLAIFYDDA